MRNITAVNVKFSVLNINLQNKTAIIIVENRLILNIKIRIHQLIIIIIIMMIIITKRWNKRITVIPTVFGAYGTISKG